MCESLMRNLFDVVSSLVASQIMLFLFPCAFFIPLVMNSDLHQTCPLVKYVSFVFGF